MTSVAPSAAIVSATATPSRFAFSEEPFVISATGSVPPPAPVSRPMIYMVRAESSARSLPPHLPPRG